MEEYGVYKSSGNLAHVDTRLPFLPLHATIREESLGTMIIIPIHPQVFVCAYIPVLFVIKNQLKVALSCKGTKYTLCLLLAKFNSLACLLVKVLFVLCVCDGANY